MVGLAYSTPHRFERVVLALAYVTHRRQEAFGLPSEVWEEVADELRRQLAAWTPSRGNVELAWGEVGTIIAVLARVGHACTTAHAGDPLPDACSPLRNIAALSVTRQPLLSPLSSEPPTFLRVDLESSFGRGSLPVLDAEATLIEVLHQRSAWLRFLVLKGDEASRLGVAALAEMPTRGHVLEVRLRRLVPTELWWSAGDGLGGTPLRICADVVAVPSQLDEDDEFDPIEIPDGVTSPVVSLACPPPHNAVQRRSIASMPALKTLTLGSGSAVAASAFLREWTADRPDGGLSPLTRVSLVISSISSGCFIVLPSSVAHLSIAFDLGVVPLLNPLTRATTRTLSEAHRKALRGLLGGDCTQHLQTLRLRGFGAKAARVGVELRTGLVVEVDE